MTDRFHDEEPLEFLELLGDWERIKCEYNLAAALEGIAVASKPRFFAPGSVEVFLADQLDGLPRILPEDVLSRLEAFERRAIEVREAIVSTDPPGELFTVDSGVSFDPRRHRAELGCPESGIVRWTTYPGYRVGDRVLEQPTVFTRRD